MKISTKSVHNIIILMLLGVIITSNGSVNSCIKKVVFVSTEPQLPPRFPLPSEGYSLLPPLSPVPPPKLLPLCPPSPPFTPELPLVQ